MRRTAAAGLIALGVAACSGENLFTGPGKGTDGEDDPPAVVAIRVPEFVRPGGVIAVEVDATGEEGITTVDIALIEATVQERSFVIDPVQTAVTTRTQFVLPSPLTRTSVTVRAVVEDQSGAQSEPREVVVPVVQDEGEGTF